MNAKPGRRGHGIVGGGGRSRSSSMRLSTATTEVNETQVDLNSRSATTVAKIVFLPAHQHSFPIIHFDCRDSLRTCQQIRQWLDSAGPEDIRKLVRFDDQELNLIGPLKKGKVILLEGAATLDGDASAQVSILALIIPNEDRIRYFWTPLSPSPLLTDLTATNLLGRPRIYISGPLRYSANGELLPPLHHTLYTILTQNFKSAITFPESPDFKAASLISDLCPSIKDPSDAARRIEANDRLHSSNDPIGDGKDLFDDRYLLDLPPAERALSCLLYTGCAEYLLLKRIYFKAFSRELVLHSQKVRRAAAARRRDETPPDNNDVDNNQEGGVDDDDEDEDVEDDSLMVDTPHSTPMATRSHAGAGLASIPTYTSARRTAARIGAVNRTLRVRTKNGHIKAVLKQTDWNWSRARKMVIGWEMLGFLEEKRVLAVVEEREDDEFVDEDEDGDEVKAEDEYEDE